MRFLCIVMAVSMTSACDRSSNLSMAESQAEVPPEPTGSLEASIADTSNFNCDTTVRVAPGFCAEIFHPGFGSSLRHIAVRDNGDVFVGRRGEEGGLFMLRDSDGDGQSDQDFRISDKSGTGVAIYNDYVYFSTPEQIVRYAFNDSEKGIAKVPEVVVTGYEDLRMHASKSIAFDDNGSMFVNVGAPSNACQNPSRTPGVKGQDPCPLLATTGGVWRFSANDLGQTPYKDDELYATGIRNGLAMTWNSATQSLFLLQHGRDQLSELWPDLYTTEQRVELPAEEFFELKKGDHFGWPFCYFDHLKDEKLLSPEYGGDGNKVGRCTKFKRPFAAYPGHWGPNDVVFYNQNAYPKKYRGGAFIAFHGSWNRAPYPQKGYNVVYQPINNGQNTGKYEIFLDGLATQGEIKSPSEANYRPTGLAVDDSGALWVSESRQGRIWRIRYRSDVEVN